MNLPTKTRINFVLSALVLSVLFSACEMSFDVDVNTSTPVVYTLNIEDVTNSSMTLYGELSDDGNDEIDELGFFYNTSGDINESNSSKVVCQQDSVIFSTQITKLEKGTIYYVAAFAQNDAGLSIGTTKEVATVQYEYGSYTDSRDENVYRTVEIGNQTWMAQNFAYLPELRSDNTVYTSNPNYFVLGYDGNSVDEAKATENYKNLGVLYNYYALESIVPAGWRIPTKEDWEELATYVGDENGSSSSYDDKWPEIGNLLKDNQAWGGEYSNAYGLSVLPSNFIDADGTVFDTNIFTYFWSSSDDEYNKIFAALIQKHQDNIWLRGVSKKLSGSIRLIKE
ncbi:MAG: FISUMP domain-containing protein [Prolixibacteraceae bacterium]|jgi:uncharacterized protein (TIGR02145 family)|nr:FISUMP domain-containing protein [Prolixibacteraceae bacterium]